jgi:RimJ/RimL family protein N-acetyltransferase
MSGRFHLETARSVLRDWRSEDWVRFWELTNTPAVMQWLGGLLDDGGKAATRTRVENCAERNGFCFWLIERKEDGGHLAGEVLGFCGLKRADAPGSTIPGEFEIGWRLREDAWGKGYAKEAAMASLDAAFGRYGAETVYALTIRENEPSWGLMKRLGMARRNDLDYPDPRYQPPWRDTVVYSLGRDDWQNHG